MSWLLLCVTHGHLLYKTSDVEAFDLVCVEKVISQIVLGEIEWNEEAGMVWRKMRCSDERNCKFGAVSNLSVWAQR